MDWIVEQDLIDAIGGNASYEKLVANPAAERADKVARMLDEAHSILQLRLGITYDVTSLDATKFRPLVHLGSRYAVLLARRRTDAGLSDPEAAEAAELAETLDSMARGGHWTGEQLAPDSADSADGGFVEIPTTRLSLATVKGVFA